jgi:hypothetical protein
MLHRNRIPVRIDCTCHDPTVFGHLTCTRAETQPNNTPPRPPDAAYTTTITANSLSAASITCALHDDIHRIGELDAAMRDTTLHVQDLTALVRYISRRYGDPHPHG